jgi:hypothetical protein
MAELLKTEVTYEQLINGVIPQNYVLCEMFFRSEGAKTKSGLIYGVNTERTYADRDNPDDDSSYAADMAETCAIVTKLPERLYFNPDDPDKSMPWDCDMELEVGDMVWTNPIESQNAVSLVCEDKIYKLLPYHELYCAKRCIKLDISLISENFSAEDFIKEWQRSGQFIYEMGSKQPSTEIINGNVICLNGYVLCLQKNKESLSHLDVTTQDKVDKTKGIVAYFGKPNKRYIQKEYTDFVDLKRGDEIILNHKCVPFLLERQLYASKFDENNLYWVIPRRGIVANLGCSK